MTTPAWPAPAKINLFLHIVGRRPDGYHLLQTAFQFLDYSDQLRFTLRDDGVIRRALGPEAMREVTAILKQSIEYSLAHRAAAFLFALRLAPGFRLYRG